MQAATTAEKTRGRHRGLRANELSVARPSGLESDHLNEPFGSQARAGRFFVGGIVGAAE